MFSVADRTQSTAFTKKEGGSSGSGKKLRSGTATSVNLLNANPTYYIEPARMQLATLNANTANDSHVNKFMQIDDALLQSIGKGHFPGTLGRDFKLFGRPALLYRRITQQLVDRLTGAPAQRAMVIDGKNGSGKSAELMKLAAVAAAKGHIVVYAHSTLPWVNSSRPYAPANEGSLFVQHELTLELLKSVLMLSKEALARVALGREVVLGKKTLTAEQTLADLVSFGIHTPSLAHDALDQLLAVASAQTQVPLLVALDNVNTLWCNTAYRDQQDAVLPAERLRLVRAFLPFFDGSRAISSGLAVGATSYSEVRFMPRDLKERLNPPPMVPLANPDVASDPKVTRPLTDVPFDVVKVDRMTAQEAWALMAFYHKTNVVSMPVTESLVAQKWVVADGNPRQIFGSVTSYF
ncbi:hypothetical protein LPJ66_004502 [Kickxella alabastrina]|uniref:Uncharacterized protein n=1 Tax=Kickxella alabastrina TaxID=61397 RepID=A0ACC1IH51_9FUNG|nr:hypothetical protein LPJ66_004502 [Kickxella alabastrina]